MRYRKNIVCLTADELHELRETLAEMYALPASDPNSFARIASFHGGPPTAYCRHGSPGFLTWHRAYLVAFENALRALGCNINLPFWDWSSGPSTGVPEPCRHPTYVNSAGDTVPNPLYSGPRAAGGQTSRRPDIDTTAFDDIAVSASAAMTSATFGSFQNALNGPHGSVHVRTGGDMGSVPTASYDPIFYLHHANVDRLWASWQASHPAALPATEAVFELQPFNRPYSTQWQRGSDVESTDALGYRYRKFCFFFPPILVWEVVQIEWLPWIREQMTSARLLIKSTRMQERPTELRAFLNQPRAGARTRTIGNPAFAGAAGFLGHGGTHGPSDRECAECARLGHTAEHAHHDHGDHKHDHDDHRQPAVPERFDVELDMTAALHALDDDAKGVSLKIIAVDQDGNEIPADEVQVDDIEIVVE